MNKDKNCNLLYQYSHMFCLLVCGHFQRIARLSVFYQIIGLRLCLEVDIQIISVLNLVLTLRLRVIPSRTRSQHWDSEKSSLGLKTETQKITVSDSASKLRLREYLSLSWESKLGLADCLSFGQSKPFSMFLIFFQFRLKYLVLLISFRRQGSQYWFASMEQDLPTWWPLMWYVLFWGDWCWPQILKSTINLRKI